MVLIRSHLSEVVLYEDADCLAEQLLECVVAGLMRRSRDPLQGMIRPGEHTCSHTTSQEQEYGVSVAILLVRFG